MNFALRVIALAAFFAVMIFVIRPMSMRRLHDLRARRALAAARRDERARQLGLTPSSGRPGLVDTRFGLFTKGDEQHVDHAYERLDGTGRAVAVVADYAHGSTWYDRDEGREVSDYTRYTVAIHRVGFSAPNTAITTENLRSRLGRLVGERDIEIEADRFNGRYRVESDDERFAVTLLDQRVVGAMIEGGPAEHCERMELIDDKILFVADRLASDDAFAFFEWTERCVDRLPPLLGEAYPIAP